MRGVLVQSALLDCSESTPSGERAGVRRFRFTPRRGCPGICDSPVRDRTQLLPVECSLVACIGDGTPLGAGKTFYGSLEASAKSQCGQPEEIRLDPCRGVECCDSDCGNARFERPGKSVADGGSVHESALI